jgi:hypothetical protein
VRLCLRSEGPLQAWLYVLIDVRQTESILYLALPHVTFPLQPIIGCALNYETGLAGGDRVVVSAAPDALLTESHGSSTSSCMWFVQPHLDCMREDLHFSLTSAAPMKLTSAESINLCPRAGSSHSEPFGQYKHYLPYAAVILVCGED